VSRSLRLEKGQEYEWPLVRGFRDVGRSDSAWLARIPFSSTCGFGRSTEGGPRTPGKERATMSALNPALPIRLL
jgi:hypothetical protein